MRLSALCAQARTRCPALDLSVVGEDDPDISGLASDSRQVQSGSLFAAVTGTHADGLAYVCDARSRGAVAVLADQPVQGMVSVVSSQVRRALAVLASCIHPGQPETIVAITGTSGKTSVAAFTRSLWAGLGYRAASIGTIGVVSPSGSAYGTLTTPDPVKLHQTLETLVDEGVSHVALEASSHGLDQCRLDGVRLKAGAFLNLSRDHLDYHPDMECYFAAKMRLLDLLPEGAPFVVALGQAWSEKAMSLARARGYEVMSVGQGGTLLDLERCVPDGFGQRLVLKSGATPFEVYLLLMGAFQVANALVALGLVVATGTPVEQALPLLAQLEGAPGRLERVGDAGGAPVFVDYAHKPDALLQLLRTLRAAVSGRLIVVFGAGGDRDAGKRRIMGEIARNEADVVIVTDDNPRSENPAHIRAAILEGAVGALEIADRAQAIHTAVAMAVAGDAVVIAGKGHETGQIVGSQIFPFSDHEVARAALMTHREQG